MKKILFILLFITVVLTGVTAKSKSKTDAVSSSSIVPYKTITMPEAAKLMDSEKGYVIVDVRTPAEYKEAHIPGAINIPLDTIGDNRISQLQKRDQMIMVYCRTGVRSRQASEKLMNKGYTNVVNIGGITSWTGKTVSGSK